MAPRPTPRPPERGAVTGSAVPGVSSQVLASWRRSADYGVSLEVVDPVFSGSFDQESLFYQCGHQVLADLHATLASEPVSLMLTDADGLVLGRMSGHTSLLRSLDAVHLAPGFSYAEREAGTNGLGLALADRAPALVRAEEHYAAGLCVYTCAAAPVLDPLTGRLEGAVNITTWSSSSHDLLLALARSAASTTSALMLARSSGAQARPVPTGQVVRLPPTRLEPGSGSVRDLSPAWTSAVDEAARALSAGLRVAAVGEAESGRSTLLAQAARRVWPRDRILCARAPLPGDVEAWLSLWTPEVGKPHTVVLVGDVDTLPAGALGRVRAVLAGADRPRVAVTAADGGGLAAGPGAVVDTVVRVAPLRERPADVVPLARAAAARARGREVDLTPAAERALEACGWPGNVGQLVRAVRQAAAAAEVVDVRHLPPEVRSGSSRRLTRIEAFERDEIVRCLSRPGATVRSAANELGMSRATIYRKLAQYEIANPRS